MKVAVLGVATTKFGELWQTSPRQLAREAVEGALIDSDLKKSQIEALYVGNMLSGVLGGQENLGAFFAEELGLACPAFKVEGACASGGLAFFSAALAVKSGEFENALVLGVEKMTDHAPEEVATGLMGAGSDEERQSGATFPALYALMARSYMHRFGASEKHLAHVAMKNHFHGSLNPRAHFSNLLTLEDVLSSPYIADPLKLYDCSPVSDGAAAVVISSNFRHKKHPVKLIGAAVATDSLGLAGRGELTSLQSTRTSANLAYKQAGLLPKNVDIAEVHDCFTIAEIIAMEDLGFCKSGDAYKVIEKELTVLGKGKLTINTSGGLKACGHPVGATGVKQVSEIVQQLRREAGKRQVDHPSVGLTHNIGGSGAVAAVHIFERA